MEKLEEYAVQFLAKLLKIYSPSGKEHKVAAFIAGEMEKLNFKIRADNVGNVIGEVGNGKPTVLLCGHMDTVPGYIPVKVIDGKIYGRGAVDAKAPPFLNDSGSPPSRRDSQRRKNRGSLCR